MKTEYLLSVNYGNCMDGMLQGFCFVECILFGTSKVSLWLHPFIDAQLLEAWIRWDMGGKRKLGLWVFTLAVQACTG